MVYQIIFFTSLILFLILFIRRFRVNGKFASRMSGVARGVGGSFFRTISNAGKKGIEIARRTKSNIPLINERNNAKVPFQELSEVNQHKFWQEESSTDKPELAGYFEEGDQLFKNGQFQEAEDFFLKAATRDPGNARVYARLGVIYLHQKSFNDAIESLKVAVKFDPHNPSRHYNLSLAYFGNDDHQKAIKSVREAISLDPITKKYRLLLEQLLEGKSKATSENN